MTCCVGRDFIKCKSNKVRGRLEKLTKSLDNFVAGETRMVLIMFSTIGNELHSLFNSQDLL